MRVLQLVQKPQRRGAEIFAAQLSAALRRGGDTVATCYLYPYPDADALALLPGDQVLGGVERHPLEKIPGVHPGLLRRAMQAIRAFQPDVVQLNGARSVKYGALAKRLMRGPEWVAIYRNIDHPGYWQRRRSQLAVYRRWVMPQIDGVVGVSAATLEAVQALYRLRGPAVVIRNGIDPQSLDVIEPVPENGAAGAPALLFVGNLTVQKRPDRFLRAAARVQAALPALRVWLVGDGPLRAELEAQAQRLGLNARFWGYQRAVGPWIAASDLLAVTSDSDGIPAVVLEAGYLARPTVATRVGGMAECVIDGETGLLVEAQDEADLAAAIGGLLADPQRRTAMGAAAARLVRQRFLIDSVAAEYRRFYEAVLAQRARG